MSRPSEKAQATHERQDAPDQVAASRQEVDPNAIGRIGPWANVGRIVMRRIASSTRTLLDQAGLTSAQAKLSGSDLTVSWLDSRNRRPDSDPDVLQTGLPLGSRLSPTHLEAIQALFSALAAKDSFIKHHCRAVSKYAGRIASRMGLGADDVDTLQTAALLHDIGKIGVPDAILNKPGPLTVAEFEVIKRHPGIGVDILEHTTFLDRELPAILHHHEWVDGSGYPFGLAGDRIPLHARILAVADSLDAMLSRRPYKKPISTTRAREELIRFRCRQFDPTVVDATLSWFDETDCRELVTAAT